MPTVHGSEELQDYINEPSQLLSGRSPYLSLLKWTRRRDGQTRQLAGSVVRQPSGGDLVSREAGCPSDGLGSHVYSMGRLR